MKAVSTIILLALILLAALAGFAKVALMEQDVEFFGRYGFSNSLLISFGLIQIAGAVLMILGKTRFIGAAIVAITFLISLVVLVMDGNIPVSIVTGVATLLLGVVMKQARAAETAETPSESSS